MISASQAFILVITMSLGTMLLRFLPFVVFSKGAPKPILYLGNVLPSAIIAMLVVYCLKNSSLLVVSKWIPEALAGALVVGLHKWKHNTLLSILIGTVFYMFLVQVAF